MIIFLTVYIYIIQLLVLGYNYQLTIYMVTDTNQYPTILLVKEKKNRSETSKT